MPQTVTSWFRLSDGTYGDWTKCADTYINGGAATTNYGANTRLRASGSANVSTSSIQRVLLWFEVPPHPTNPGATVSDITLYLRNDGAGATAGPPDVMRGHSILRGWMENQATWNVYDGITAWGTAGAENATDRGQVWAWEDVDPTAAAWEAFGLPEYVLQNGVSVGDDVNLQLVCNNEASAADIRFHSTESTTATPTWPSGSPASWGTGAGDYYRPVIKVTYVDPRPSPTEDFKAAPAANPALAEFKWGATSDTDALRYALRYATSAGVTGSSAFVTLDGWGAADITAPGTTTAKMGAGATFAENTKYWVSLFTEDEANVDLYATPSPEVVIIRPTNTATNAEHGGGGALPRTFEFGDLTTTPSSYTVGDKIALCFVGKGDLFTADQLVLDPKRVDVDWADGTGVQEFTPKITRLTSNASANDTSLAVQDSGIFVDGVDFAVISNGTNYDVFRITGKSGTSITIETDLGAPYSDGLRYAYTAAASTIYTLPTHVVTGHASSWAVKARLLNSHGFASDWKTCSGSPAIATLAPVAVIDANIKAPLSTDTVRYTASRSYNRNSSRPITSYRWSVDHAGTAGDPDADTTTTTVPYTTHNHGSAGTCRVALRVYDGTTFSATGNDYGDASNPQGDISLTVTAATTVDLTSLTNKATYPIRLEFESGGVVIDGIDVSERVYVSSGPGSQTYRYHIIAHVDTDADLNPDSMESTLAGIVARSNFTDSIATKSGMATATGIAVGRVSCERFGPAEYMLDFSVNYPKLT